MIIITIKKMLPVLAASAYSICLLFVTGVIPGWGRWYSTSPYYQLQVEALMRGSLSLSNSPSSLMFDLAWSEGGVQQVWGLGVPLGRLPFVALARLLGAPDFPDMIIFCVALGLAAWMVVNTFLSQGYLKSTGSRKPSLSWIMPAGIVIILLLFPPFMGLLRSRFEVYEEAMAYQYLFGMVLLCLIAALAIKPGHRRFYLLCFLAGLGALVRPTLFVYGVAAVFSGWLALISGQLSPAYPGRTAISLNRLKPLFLGICLFGIGTVLLFVTNQARFGSALEFGHRLNITASGLVYATRFDYPYQRAPLLHAVRELFSVLFLSPDFNYGKWYLPHFFPGQSETLRWREFYFSTYDLGYLFILVVGTAAGLLSALKLKIGGVKDDVAYISSSRLIIMLASWGAASSFVLFLFYLRTPLLSSRYMLDFMPAFVALLVVSWLVICRLCLQNRYSALLAPLALAFLCGWVVMQIAQFRSSDDYRNKVIPWKVSRMQRDLIMKKAGVQPTLPSEYNSIGDYVRTGLVYNGTGVQKDGYVAPVVFLFVEDPRFLEIEVSKGDASAPDMDFESVRAKVGLEYLDKESVSETPRGWLVRFLSPRLPHYQRGVQPVFLTFVPCSELDETVTNLRLLKVRWR